MQISYFNPARTFLTAYDLCLRSAPPDYCRQKVSEGAPMAIDVYLRSYETCAQVLGSENCQKILAPDPVSPATVIPLIAIGFLFGYLFRGKKDAKKAAKRS